MYMCMCVYRHPWWLSGKESTCSAGDLGSIPGLGRSLEEGGSNPLHYSCLGNLMVRGAWQATVHGVAKESDVIQRLKNNSKMVCHPICDTNVYLVWTVKS